ncbi:MULTISPECIES: 1-deoxy-D-xylulose-5-phosphate reductoisomerase [unclassified Exiguobacterium]|uniref:1-deoxy-D-xylulose-5-phosphate reductoisomerase n=1 Tax=unclassified Exiguobacterium TaxID=2644629 RepID=UPI001BE9F3FD|nr:MULTISPECIES: 1-deoxy-D-xylulose-5-phosphate reductoisomerase [unclassified Exiguobacterium]
MKKVSIIGGTGSIGTQTLDVIAANPEQFQLVSFAFGKNIDVAVPWLNRLRPMLVSVMDEVTRGQLQKLLDYRPTILTGDQGLIDVATMEEADIVITAVVGAVGLRPTLAAIEAGKTIGLANKETLVTAGHLVMKKAREKGVAILPVDSEHAAIFQCLNGERREDVRQIILTASGGSFRDMTRDQLADVTVEQALNHPNWSMGAKITIDSATMMNKGFEVIEAHWLFDVAYEEIDVVIHRESIIHSMVEFNDGAVMAQLGMPDMREPIQYALTYPSRLEIKGGERLNLKEIGRLNFAEASFERYPLLRLAFEAGSAGGSMPSVLNAANEQAVDRFLKGEISFLEIEVSVEAALRAHELINDPSLDQILEADRWARAFVASLSLAN